MGKLRLFQLSKAKIIEGFFEFFSSGEAPKKNLQNYMKKFKNVGDRIFNLILRGNFKVESEVIFRVGADHKKW